jgi:hypothetical protein
MKTVACLIVFSLCGVIPAHAMSLGSTGNYHYSLSGYSRIDAVSMKNAVDLDSANSDDTSSYLGIDYSLGFKAESQNDGVSCFLKLERNGPWDYDAPVFVHNTLATSSGRVEAYRRDELLPGIEEYWFDAPLASSARCKAGLFTYAVGNEFSLNGAYENYGLLVYGKNPAALWRFYYCRPDLSYEYRLGPRIRQEEEQGQVYNHNAANFFASDITFCTKGFSLQPYVGLLADYTKPESRDSVFTTPVKRDLLGTIGYAAQVKQGNVSVKLEMARNFGEATSDDPLLENIEHTGYLVFSEARVEAGRCTPVLQCVLASGNEATVDMAAGQDETFSGSKNKAFSTYSPFNLNLGDSICGNNAEMRPVVAGGAGFGVQYGVPRPGTFAVSDFDNIVIPAIGIDMRLTDKGTLSVFGYYLRALERGVGTFDGEARKLSADLGREIDVFYDHRVSEKVLVSFLAGCFFPGDYYKEERDDASGSILSPFVRGSGDADVAYQVEVALECTF